MREERNPETQILSVLGVLVANSAEMARESTIRLGEEEVAVAAAAAAAAAVTVVEDINPEIINENAVTMSIRDLPRMDMETETEMAMVNPESRVSAIRCTRIDATMRRKVLRVKISRQAETAERALQTSTTEVWVPHKCK